MTTYIELDMPGRNPYDVIELNNAQLLVPEGNSLLIARCYDAIIVLATTAGRTVVSTCDEAEHVETFNDPAIAGWCGYCDCAMVRCATCHGTPTCAMQMEDEDAEGKPICSACYDDLHPYCGWCDSETCEGTPNCD